GEYLLGGATSSSFPCSGQPYWVPVRKPRGPSLRVRGRSPIVPCGRPPGQRPSRGRADLVQALAGVARRRSGQLASTARLAGRGCSTRR
ncbi:hypothetical protein ABZT44_55025, partial [Streptomyces mirabilis]